MLRRLAFVQVAQRVGLTLEEIGRALATLPDEDRHPGPGPRYLLGDPPPAPPRVPADSQGSLSTDDDDRRYGRPA